MRRVVVGLLLVALGAALLSWQGRPVWTAPLPVSARSVGGLLFLADGGPLIALEPGTGGTKWTAFGRVRLRSFAFSEDRRWAGGPDAEGRFHWVDTSDGTERACESPPDEVGEPLFSPDARWAVLKTQFAGGYRLAVLDLRAGRIVARLEGYAHGFAGKLFVHETRGERDLVLWDMERQREAMRLHGSRLLRLSADGRVMVDQDGCEASVFRLDPPEGPRRMATIPMPTAAEVELARDGSILAVVPYRATEPMRVWDCATGAILATQARPSLRSHPFSSNAWLSEDGERLIVSGSTSGSWFRPIRDEAIHAYEARTLRPVWDRKGVTIVREAGLRHGRLVVSDGSRYANLDAATGEGTEIARTAERHADVSGQRLTPDGTFWAQERTKPDPPATWQARLGSFFRRGVDTRPTVIALDPRRSGTAFLHADDRLKEFVPLQDGVVLVLDDGNRRWAERRTLEKEATWPAWACLLSGSLLLLSVARRVK